MFSGGDVGTLFEWPEVKLLLWVGIRMAFFFYLGVLLWDSDEKIESLERSERHLCDIIGELESRLRQKETNHGSF